MVNKNKTSIQSSLSLGWALLFIMVVKTHIDVPFQRKTPSDLLKIAKNSQLNVINYILVSKY